MVPNIINMSNANRDAKRMQTYSCYVSMEYYKDVRAMPPFHIAESTTAINLRYRNVPVKE